MSGANEAKETDATARTLDKFGDLARGRQFAIGMLAAVGQNENAFREVIVSTEGVCVHGQRGRKGALSRLSLRKRTNDRIGSFPRGARPFFRWRFYN